LKLKAILPLLLAAPALLFADEISLKGGGSLSGWIVEQTATSITIDIGDGVVGVPVSRVAADQTRHDAGRPQGLRVMVDKVEISPPLSDDLFEMPVTDGP